MVQTARNFPHISIYVPPDSPLSYVSSLVLFLSDLVSSFSKCTFVGDFNFPDIDWFALMGTSISSTCLCDFVFDYNFTQHIFEPTHVKGNVLDLVLTSPCVSVTNLTIHPLPPPPSLRSLHHYFRPVL